MVFLRRSGGRWQGTLRPRERGTEAEIPLDTSSLTTLIRSRSDRLPWFKMYLGLALALLLISLSGGPVAWSVCLVLCAAIGIPVRSWDRRRRSLFLAFDPLDSTVAGPNSRVQQLMDAWRSSQRLWEVESRAETNQWKQHAGANALLTRTPVMLVDGTLEGVQTQVPTPMLIGRTRLVFLPSHLAVWSFGRVTLIEYDAVGIEHGSTRFIEEGSLPTDAVVVGSTWLHPNRDGGPDRRFAENRQLPRVDYGLVSLVMPSLAHLELQTSDRASAARIAEAFATCRLPPPAELPAGDDEFVATSPTTQTPFAPPMRAPPSKPEATSELPDRRRQVPMPPVPPSKPSDALTDLVPGTRERAPVSFTIPEPPHELRSPSPPAVPPVPTARRGLPPLPPPGKAPAQSTVSLHATPSLASEPPWRWVPSGESVTICGVTVPGGMLYVGTALSAVEHVGPEPSLIDPSLPITFQQADRYGALMPYWPAYDSMSPHSRGAYVEWLHGGRSAPDAYIGYVFLFFYGLERRLLNEAEGPINPEEAAALCDEVRRLKALYDGNPSFRAYATNLLSAAGALGIAPLPTADALPHEAPGTVPDPLRHVLAHHHFHQLPVPATYALVWARALTPDARRTPAHRCRAEFDRLFQGRYAARHGAGLVLKRAQGARRAPYTPASPGLRGRAVLRSLYDVAECEKYIGILSEVTASCCNDLDPLSRWRGKHGDADPLAEVALLPAELLSDHPSPALAKLRETISEALGDAGWVVIEGSVLAPHWPALRSGKPGKGDAVAMAQTLAAIGFGLEPDVRFGGPVPTIDAPAVLFRLEGDVLAAPTPAYSGACSLMALGATVAAADGVVTDGEVQHLLAQADRTAGLVPAEHARLHAHTRWLLARKPNLSAVKKNIAGIAVAEREAVAQFLVTIAGADGRIDPTEIATLTKLYTALELDPRRVYTDVHALASGEDTTTPPRASRPGANSPAVRSVLLDPTKVAAKQKETAAVAALLGSIFSEDAVAAAPEPATGSLPARPTPAVPPLEGLDDRHSNLLRALRAQDTWSRTDVEKFCADLRLMPVGALDMLNEAAMDRHGAPLFEGDDPIVIDRTVMTEWMP